MFVVIFICLYILYIYTALKYREIQGSSHEHCCQISGLVESGGGSSHERVQISKLVASGNGFSHEQWPLFVTRPPLLKQPRGLMELPGGLVTNSAKLVD